MYARAREPAALLCALIAAAAIAVVSLLTLRQPGWLDYGHEAQPAVDALVRGHFGRFLALAPSYGGSLLLRAPVLLVLHAAGANANWLYRASALMCLLAAAALGLWLAAHLRARGAGLGAQALTVGVCVANPMVFQAIHWGHPEEILGGALCLFSVLAALRDRPTLAGVLLGLAVANKEWALVAVGPVLLALPERRGRALAWAALSGGLLLAPFLLAGDVNAAAATGSTFQRWQMWWFFGAPGSNLAAHPLAIGYRSAPSWVSPLAHPLIVAVALCLSGAVAWVRRRGRGAWPRGAADGADPLLVLALVLLARCVLDPYDVSYYSLPFLLALTGWETEGAGRPPVGALLASLGTWFVFEETAKPVLGLSTDAQAAVFLMIAFGAMAAICARLCWPPRRREAILAAT